MFDGGWLTFRKHFGKIRMIKLLITRGLLEVNIVIISARKIYTI